VPARPHPAAEAAARLGERVGRPLGAGAPPGRWRIEPSAALLLAAVAVAVVGWLAWSALRPEPVAIQASIESPGEPWPDASASPATPEPAASAIGPPAEVVVDVQGAVARPGVHRLPAGSRVVDAVAAAGGPVAGGAAPGLNLARVLVDGEQLVVGATVGADPPAVGSAAAGGPAAGDGKVDLNRASLPELDGLPGVGPVLAQRILDFRAKAGRFRSVEELREVSGIGERTYARLAPLVRV
jgi:competence protein ComEA